MKKTKLLQLLHKLKRFVLVHDWTWSVLLTFFAYMFVNYGPPVLFNVPMAYFTINWIQPLVATAGVMSGLYSIARLGLYFNIRKMHDYMYGNKNKVDNSKSIKEIEDEMRVLRSYKSDTPSLSMRSYFTTEIEKRQQKLKQLNEPVPKFFNPSYIDFKKLTPWQRLLLLSLYLFFLFVAALIVFLKFIPLSAPA